MADDPVESARAQAVAQAQGAKEPLWLTLLKSNGISASMLILASIYVVSNIEKLGGRIDRLDEKISGIESRLDTKIGAVEGKLDVKIDSVEKNLNQHRASHLNGIGAGTQDNSAESLDTGNGLHLKNLPNSAKLRDPPVCVLKGPLIRMPCEQATNCASADAFDPTYFRKVRLKVKAGDWMMICEEKKKGTSAPPASSN